MTKIFTSLLFCIKIHKNGRYFNSFIKAASGLAPPSKKFPKSTKHLIFCVFPSIINISFSNSVLVSPPSTQRPFCPRPLFFCHFFVPAADAFPEEPASVLLPLLRGILQIAAPEGYLIKITAFEAMFLMNIRSILRASYRCHNRRMAYRTRINHLGRLPLL